MRPKAPHLREAIDTLFASGPATHETYTHLALQCFRSNDVESARRLQTHMDTHLYQPKDTFLYNRLLHLYSKSGQVSYARTVFDKMPQRDVFSWNAMLSLYSKSGSIWELESVFKAMPFRDSVSFNTVISGFAGCAFGVKALRAFATMVREGFEPTEYTHVSVLNVCVKMVALRMGKQVHGRIVTGNSGGGVFVRNVLIDMYSKCGEYDQARWLFDRISDKSIVSWNSMIFGYLRNGHLRKCIELFSEMQNSGFKPDQYTFSSVLCAYIQSGCIEEACKIFGEIKEKDKVCWTTMIVGYTQNGREEDALILFREMLLMNVKPDGYTISSVISSCAKLASLHHGQVVHGRALLCGVEDDLLVSSALVDMYCKCGVTTDAWDVFSMMANKNVVSWNAMIRGYAQNGQDFKALDLYEKMLKEKLKPDDITFVGVLSACNNAGLVKEGKRYFYSMSELHEQKPTLDHYACLISLLGRSGNMDEAIELVTSMPHEPNSLIWSTILSVSATKSDVQHGELAARHLFELDPLDAGPYIILSNMYASCGRWKDVASTRALMKSRNVKKFAAYSWIDIDNEVHKFIADDRTHPETKIIYGELNRLIKELQEAGFIPNTNLVLHDIEEAEKFESICYHSEKLALSLGLIRKPYSSLPIRIIKNIRVCSDCHLFMKFVSKVKGRHIVLRDSSRFHHFVDGKCACKDYW